MNFYNKKKLDFFQFFSLKDHPNILKVFEFFHDEKYFYIVTELCLGGELFDKIVEVKSFDEYNAVDVMNQLLSAVAYCHAQNIVHR